MTNVDLSDLIWGGGTLDAATAAEVSALHAALVAAGGLPATTIAAAHELIGANRSNGYAVTSILDDEELPFPVPHTDDLLALGRPPAHLLRYALAA
ncbi:hypothetical protein ACFVAJ_19335 [Agromyces sp. NPDC057679]|uniref:hypothetical protein n=1 Tax=Agromyces sp. NPDC057679 TaxID=3346207 RepID=UPI003672BD74